MSLALTYRGGLGADPFTDWIATVKSSGGVATAWPFSAGIYGKYYGRPAAKFTGANYARAANAGLLDMTQPQQATSNSAYVYVLAPGTVAASAPPTMNWLQAAANEAFSIGDASAAFVGLPSLASIEKFLKSLGMDALLLGGVIGLAVYLIRRND